MVVIAIYFIGFEIFVSIYFFTFLFILLHLSISLVVSLFSFLNVL